MGTGRVARCWARGAWADLILCLTTFRWTTKRDG